MSLKPHLGERYAHGEYEHQSKAVSARVKCRRHDITEFHKSNPVVVDRMSIKRYFSQVPSSLDERPPKKLKESKLPGVLLVLHSFNPKCLSIYDRPSSP